MAIITNYLLFNHTYLRKLQADSSVDERASFVAQGVRDWYGFRDDASIESLVFSWVQPVLNSLELDLQSSGRGNGHVHLLYRVSDWSEPVGLCYVTPPGADLDTTTKGRHWMAQAVLTARRWEPAAESGGEDKADDGEGLALRWVILTNGNQWRLLDAQALRRYEAYLQVDLEEMVRDPGDLSALRLFYHCFHRSAFERGAEGRSGLDRLLDESNHATKQAEDHLKARVSDDDGIMARLCRGFVESTGKTRFSEEERGAIYQDATFLLYRMLFILYAEARNLLPVNNPTYEKVSLKALADKVHEYRQNGIPDPNATTLWDGLKRLCGAIYASDPAVGIPAYNGGLFDDDDKPYVRDAYVKDAYLTDALFDMMYQPRQGAPGGYQPIDYRDLSVRHLGSLYEGMIEYKLFVAEEPLLARRDTKANLHYLTLVEAGAAKRTDQRIERGDVYFAQSPGERRATGTYYTPEYVVDYIVRETVVHELRERRLLLDEKLSGWLEELVAALSNDEEARMKQTIDRALLQFVEEQVLSFRVCDPAMGSGHFLVNTAHQMTAFIVETLHQTGWTNAELDASPAIWRRHVVECCLYGVDLNLMAVELAKLSLWLASVAEGRPLSFLDHHLRQGNSLIGARLKDLAGFLAEVSPTPRSRQERKELEAGQLSMLDHPAFRQHLTAATNLLVQITGRIAKTVEDVKAQETDFAHVRVELRPYRQVADLWTASQLGFSLDKQQLGATAKQLLHGSPSEEATCEQLLKQVQGLGTERHFFHWELEFPEAYFAAQNQAQGLRSDECGFNAVVGNPPYIPNEQMERSERAFFAIHYPVSSGKYDLSVVFLDQSSKLVASSGRFGMIVPTTWQTGDNYVPFRRDNIVQGRFGPSAVVNLPFDVFPDAYIDTCIAIFSKPASDSFSVFAYPKQIHIDRIEVASHESDAVSRAQIGEEPWHRLFMNSSHYHFLAKLTEPFCISLGDVTDACQGPVESFFEYSDRDAGEDYLPYATCNVYRYEMEVVRRRWILFGKDNPLKRFYVNPRILIRRIVSRGNRLMATISMEPFVVRKDLNPFVLTQPQYDLHFLLANVNSLLHSYLYTQASAAAGKDDFRQTTLSALRALPIRRIEFHTPDDTRSKLLKDSIHLSEEYTETADQHDVFGFVEFQLEQKPARTDVVHDMVSYLAQQMIHLNKERQRLESEVDFFRFVEPARPCLRLARALGGHLIDGEMLTSLSDMHHDIEGLRLSQEADGPWLLEALAKLRDPDSGWREYQRDTDGSFIREWLLAFRLLLDEATGRFYHYAFANLDGFDGAGKFPGGYTRTTLEKLKATKVPKFVSVDLAPLAALETELAEVRRKIQLTDDLIDQIVYRLYGLTEEEIAIVEGKA